MNNLFSCFILHYQPHPMYWENFPPTIVQSPHFDSTQLYVDCTGFFHFLPWSTSHTHHFFYTTFPQLDLVLLNELLYEAVLVFPKHMISFHININYKLNTISLLNNRINSLYLKLRYRIYNIVYNTILQ